MIDWLVNLDQALFAFVNLELANPVTDIVMPIVTSDNLLRILYGVAMLLLLWKGSPRLRWMVLFSAMVLLLTDQLAANFLKEWIARPRPCHVIGEVHLLVGCGSGFSMPSAHAANAFGQASLFSYRYRQVRWYLYLSASLIAVSRVFVGVHYPGDVLAGAIVGAAVGLSLGAGFGRFEKSLQQRRKRQ